MLSRYDFLAGGLLPAVVAALILIAGWRVTRRTGARESRTAAAPLAIGLGFGAGWLALFGRGPFPPVDSTDWLLHISVPLALVALVESCREAPIPLRVALALVAVPLTAWLLARPLLAAGVPDFGWGALCLVSVLGIGWIAAMDALAVHVSARRLGTYLLVAIVPASIALLLGQSQRLMQICGLVATAQIGAVVTQFFLGSAGTAQGTPLVIGVLYGGSLMCGALYANLGWTSAALLFVAPLAAWIAHAARRPLGRWTPFVACTLVVIPVVVALIPLAIKFFSRAHEY